VDEAKAKNYPGEGTILFVAATRREKPKKSHEYSLEKAKKRRKTKILTVKDPLRSSAQQFFCARV